ncbi:extracellular solute-binding protein [Pseudaestuariivita sp.]|uniref:extracellular solute-binding protein n=1 Tax=Pseudaestuariivita sp. TaxID=2211669 RepID=UPI004059A187
MRSVFFHRQTWKWGAAAGLALLANVAISGPEHGIAMYGEPQLPPDFVSLPYANPDAPTGGRIVTGEVGSFDSLNPHILKGRVPWQLRFLAYESLMGRSWDEPFTLYGLLAESIETDEDRTWAEFTLREEARFSDGSPVTVEDVMWSYETLGTVGHPRYHGLWGNIASMEQTGERSVKFTFEGENRELALIVGMRPILQKAQWEGKDFAESGLDNIPIASAPYVIDDFEAGRFVSLKRNPDYWGKDIPFRRGTNVIDEIRMEFYGDGTAQFEAFKAGELNSNREFNAEKWATQYAFPSIEAGDVVKSLIPNARPSGMTGFVMNTRRAPFDDWRVRDAMLHAFNFEYINDTVTGGRQDRITSFFSNSYLGKEDGAASGRVAELLAPYEADLFPGAVEGYALPASDGSERNRAGTRAAIAQLEAAGYTLEEGVMTGPDGALAFEILLRQGSTEERAMANIFIQALERIGVAANLEVVESAQYKERTNAFDFDMTWQRFGLSLSPGNEQYRYFGAENVDVEGQRNWAGVNQPVVDAMIASMLGSVSREDFIASVRAMDRALMAGRYFLPTYVYTEGRIAHDARLKFPETLPIYGDWIGWQPDVWWWEE